MLWPPVAVLAVMGSIGLVRWARPRADDLRLERGIVLIDPTPRREIRLMRANHRRDVRVALLALIAGIGGGFIPAVLTNAFGLRGK
ncbi:hypothetical protein [Blastococcus sp. TF02A-35]|uniref:hypothetical protein n=1 Tax=Blastococcus sp. TF02A-35 TaxID=2559612 RepID=UPI001073753F|nr:hypothetical protein [Blastococcus sp. TF02A_35]TFV53411.1 hypothetical protein E4P43_02420 [Blastococcus sp. TF02A_35]